ncbi:hypothetical protein PG990_013891 [Apiospora arundinis]
MVKRKHTPKQLERMLSGGGGGHDLPSLQEVLARDHGFGTYRGKFNSIATLGLELPVLNIGKNPPGYYYSSDSRHKGPGDKQTTLGKRKRAATKKCQTSKRSCQSTSNGDRKVGGKNEEENVDERALTGS